MHEQNRDADVLVVRDDPPCTKNVAGTNYVHICPNVTQGKIVVLSTLDNLTKGAAGQAVQCLNIMCGYEETLGLL